MKIAIAGFHHETNILASRKASFDDFKIADGWPPLSIGDALINNVDGVNIPIAGFIEKSKEYNFELIPVLWCSAQPSSYVETDAFEQISNQIIDILKQSRSLDAIFLDLHGAMVVENFPDGEGELLKRIRKIYPNIPIFVALDFHANVSDEMFNLADFITCYREYPHIDMAATGARVAKFINNWNSLRRPIIHKAFSRVDFQIRVTSQCTLSKPAIHIKELVEKISESKDIIISASFGFPPSGGEFAYPSIYAYSLYKTTQYLSDKVRNVENLFNAHKDNFETIFYSEKEAIDIALKHNSSKPLIIVDTQDNPGAGGDSDTTGILHEMLAANLANSAIALICDPESAAYAHEIGEGGKAQFSIGAKISPEFGSPVTGEFEVIKVTDGSFKATGKMYGGSNMNLGKMALLKKGGVNILISSIKQQAADRSIFRHLGLEPEKLRVIVLKSSVHFRADFEQIADKIIIAKSAGKNPT